MSDSLVVGYPNFNERFGSLVDGSYQISAGWQSALNNCGTVGQIVGLLVGRIAFSFAEPEYEAMLTV